MMIKFGQSYTYLCKKYEPKWKSCMLRIYLRSWQWLPKYCFGKIYVGTYVYTCMCRHVSTQHTHASQPQPGKPIQSFSLEDNWKNPCSWQRSLSCCKCNFFLISHLKKKWVIFPHYRWDKYIRSTSDKEALSVEHQPKGLRLSNKLIHHMGVNV